MITLELMSAWPDDPEVKAWSHDGLRPLGFEQDVYPRTRMPRKLKKRIGCGKCYKHPDGGYVVRFRKYSTMFIPGREYGEEPSLPRARYDQA